jgi:hypothetical protein
LEARIPRIVLLTMEAQSHRGKPVFELVGIREIRVCC